MTARDNAAWNLERFVDALVVELDRTKDTLAMKGITRKLTYTVKDLNLDLQVFPRYDGGKIRFVTAAPGEEGSSRLSLQLGSITDRQIRENVRPPTDADDVDLEDIEDIDEETRSDLRSIGVHSANDLEQLERRNVNVEGALKQKRVRKEDLRGGADYGNLANLIKRARRGPHAPSVRSVSLGGAASEELALEGENLVMSFDLPNFPVATINDHHVAFLGGDARSLRLSVPPHVLHRSRANKLRVALDPYTLIHLEIEG